LGKWTLGLAVICILFLGLLFALKDPLLWVGFTFGWLISGIAAFGLGLISIIRSKERAILVFLAVIAPALILLFGIIGAILGP